MKPIFHKGPPLIARIAFFILLAILIFVLDTRTNALSSLRASVMTLSTPLYWISSLTSRLGDWSEDTLASRETLQIENMTLRAENRALQQKLQKMATIVAENARLTELLNSSHAIDGDVLIAQIVGISPDPQRQEIRLDKGSSSGAQTGQAVLDANGVAGLVIETSSGSSRVMLITDSRSAIPVQLVRNGFRFIAEGIGSNNVLSIRHVSATTDIVEGDVLVSSGLDQHYPANYPVAKVTRITQDPTLPFLTVQAEPIAQLNRSRHFLLVLAIDTQQTP